MWTIFGRVVWSPYCKMLDTAQIVQKGLLTCLVYDKAPVNPGAGG